LARLIILFTVKCRNDHRVIGVPFEYPGAVDDPLPPAKWFENIAALVYRRISAMDEPDRTCVECGLVLRGRNDSFMITGLMVDAKTLEEGNALLSRCADQTDTAVYTTNQKKN
jgi:hypothetical protein